MDNDLLDLANMLCTSRYEHGGRQLNRAVIAQISTRAGAPNRQHRSRREDISALMAAAKVLVRLG